MRNAFIFILWKSRVLPLFHPQFNESYFEYSVSKNFLLNTKNKQLLKNGTTFSNFICLVDTFKKRHKKALIAVVLFSMNAA